MRKRMLSWGLILSLLLTMLPVSAMAAESGEPEAEPTEITYTLSPDTEIHSANTLTSTGTADHSNHTDWTPLSGAISSNSFYQDGNYYLNGNRTTYSDITINSDVTLCLNSHTLDIGQNTTFTVSSGATLTICDCGSGGTITGTESYINLNVISVESGTLNLESGTISGTTTGSGSLISVTDGELNVTGGTISLNHTGSGAYDGVQAVKLSEDSTGSFTGGEVSLTTAVENDRATTVYQEGGIVTVGGSAEISFKTEEDSITPGCAALCVTSSGQATINTGCTITASRTDGGMKGAVSIGMLGNATGTATITGGDINGFLVVYGTAEISDGSFAYIENRGTLTMTGGTVMNNIDYGIWTSGATTLGNVSITAPTGIYVSQGRPTIGDGVTIHATQYGMYGAAALVGAPSISGDTADLYICSMKATTEYPSVDATQYTGDALSVQEREFPDAHQGGYIGCAIQVPQENQSLFSLTNSDGNFVYQYDTENSALRLYNQNAHPICGASCDHGDASHSNPAWQKWSTPSYTLTGGSYYLTGTVTLSQPITITGDVNLCLNGNTIKRSDGSSPFQVSDGGSLTICDCQTTGKLTGGITATGGNIGIYGGTLSGGAYAVDLGGSAKLTLAGSPALSGTSAALKLYTQSGTTLENAAVDATNYTGGSLEVEENDVPGGANGFAIKGGDGKFSLKNDSDGYHYAYEGGYVIRPDHTHSYTYSGSGAVITETCTCNHSATATLSIRADADLTYTGSAITPAEVTYSDGWEGGNLTPTYENNVNAGTATATITKDNAIASVTFTIEKANQTEPTASDCTIDYPSETITSITSGCKVYTAEDGSTEVQTGELVTPGTTYYIRREGDANHNPSGFTSFTVTARPAAPTVTAVAETIKGKRDGKVTGVNDTMEYSTDDGQNWQDCPGTEITDLAAGTAVTVRVKATAAAPHGETASCNIPEGTTTLTVTFEENGGSVVDDMDGLSYDVAISAPTAPTKTGYTFAGWYKDVALTDEWDFGSDTVTENITLYAKWTAASDTAYTVHHWQQNLGAADEENEQNYTCFATENLTGATGASVTPAIKSYEGFTAPSVQNVAIDADGSTEVNYYYTRNSYTVTLTAGNGIASVSGAGTYQYGETVSISATVSAGYAWSKWSNNSTGQNYDFTMGAADVSYTAQATPIAYTISYELDGGILAEDEINPESYTVESAPITLRNPTRTGYTFAGWTGTDLSASSTTVTIAQGSIGDRTYTAHWTANTYQVTLNTNGGTLSDPVTSYTYGTAVSLPAPTKTGYTFAGWYDNEGFSGDAVTEITAIDTGNKTFYAKWTLEVPTVKLTADKNDVTYGEEITLTAALSHAATGLTYTYEWYKDDAALPGKTESTLTLTDVADSGSYHVAVTVGDGSQSKTVFSTQVKVEVKSLGIAVTWSGLTWVYGDTKPEVGAVLGGVLKGDACTLSAITYQQDDTSVTAPNNAGEYTAMVSLTGDDAANYTLKNGSATLIIRPKTVGFTVTDNAVEGDDTAQTATVTPTDNTLTQAGYTVTYRQGTVTVAAPSSVGSYEIWVKITDGNYQHTNGKAEMQVGTLTITQAPPVLCDVTFSSGEGAIGTAPDKLSAVANAKIILPECTFERKGYLFTGWLYDGKTYQPGDGFTMPAQNVTFTAQWQQTYGITVTVQEPKPEGEDMQTVSGAVVSLCLGANKLDEQTTTADGACTFADLLPGIYNLVVTKGDRTVTSMVEITEENVDCIAILPEGATNSIVKVTEGSPDIVVGNLDTVFHQEPDDTVYTEADQTTIIGGGKVEFTFTADEKQRGDSTISSDMDKIAEKKDDTVTVGLVMDYKLEKEVFDADGQKIDSASQTITQSNVLLEILLPLPAELQGKADYAVYRVHNNEAEAMKANPGSGEEGFKVEGSYITIYAQKFSTYAIGYSETPLTSDDDDTPIGGGSSSGGGSTPTYSPSIVQPEHGTVTVSPKNPQKGDKVTITTTPEDGYTVDTVKVTDANGKIVEVTPNDDGTYTFVQPSGKVTITVTFRQMTDTSDCPRDESCPMATFTDADRSAWYHDGIHYCVEHGLMEGTGKTTFSPNNATTRGMIVTILWRLEGSPIVSTSLDYDDVKPEDWYGEAVRWADSAGVVTGYGNGKFGPNDPITREQMAAMLWRYAGSPKADGSLSSFVDGAQTSSWAQPATIWAVEQGLIAGVGNDRLEPGGQATRAQAATILMRFAQDVAQ